jgi:hypothetical protein
LLGAIEDNGAGCFFISLANRCRGFGKNILEKVVTVVATAELLKESFR